MLDGDAMRYLLLILLSASLLAQAPRAAKKGEERTPFADRNGSKCGTMAKVDTRWYFYLLAPAEKSNAVSPGFDTRKEALAWAMRYCPKPGTPVVAK